VAPQYDFHRLLPVPDRNPRISAEIVPVADETASAARELRRLGFRVLSIDDTISVDGPQSLWTSIFSVRFEEQSKPALAGVLEETDTYQKAVKSSLKIPLELGHLIRSIAFVEPPELF
jgi:hypothetical protein